MTVQLLSVDDYRRAVTLRDLSDPAQGAHALQSILHLAIDALRHHWQCEVVLHRANPVIPIEDNYDRLRYTARAAARDARYTRYVSTRLLLRTHTSAMIPGLLASRAGDLPDDVLLACPGLVYRRDVIDRLHTGEPHQLDLWRIRRGPELGPAHLEEMAATLVTALLPGARYRVTPVQHPYTLGGRQVDAQVPGGDWVEVAECGLAHPEVLAAAGLDTRTTSGLALGMGLDRMLMLRKNIDDIRLLRSRDPRVAAQMLDLAPYRPVSDKPAVRRDLSVAVAEHLTEEEIGDQVRSALAGEPDRLSAIEAIDVVGETPRSALPVAAIERMGLREGQKNVLLRLVLRHLERTLTREEANRIRDDVYRALHRGERHELIGGDADGIDQRG
jgi:phenylalanyl-tRNA synthetase alpha chain